MQVMNPCQHCGSRRSKGRGPGLCQQCYAAPELRQRYFPPVDSRTQRTGPAPLPAEPTSHPPGSPGRVAVLEERATRREQLFQTLDAQGEWERLAPPTPKRKPRTPSRTCRLRAVGLSELANGAVSIRRLARRLGHRSATYVCLIVRQLVKEGWSGRRRTGLFWRRTPR